jgi:hypothetical protein
VGLHHAKHGDGAVVSPSTRWPDHLIADNLSSHKSPAIPAWSARARNEAGIYPDIRRLRQPYGVLLLRHWRGLINDADDESCDALAQGRTCTTATARTATNA